MGADGFTVWSQQQIHHDWGRHIHNEMIWTLPNVGVPHFGEAPVVDNLVVLFIIISLMCSVPSGFFRVTLLPERHEPYPLSLCAGVNGISYEPDKMLEECRDKPLGDALAASQQ